MQQKRTVPRVCPACGKHFLIRAALAKSGAGQCCSRQCSGRYHRIPVRPITINPDGTASVLLGGRGGAIRATAIIDAADVPLVDRWNWSLRDGYAVRADYSGPRPKAVWLHRVILGLADNDYRRVDHIDRNRLNSRRSNLRPVTPSGNSQNTPSKWGTSSQFRGVTWSKQRQKWIATVRAAGRLHYLGGFESERDAADAARKGRAALLPFAAD